MGAVQPVMPCMPVSKQMEHEVKFDQTEASMLMVCGVN